MFVFVCVCLSVSLVVDVVVVVLVIVVVIVAVAVVVAPPKKLGFLAFDVDDVGRGFARPIVYSPGELT